MRYLCIIFCLVLSSTASLVAQAPDPSAEVRELKEEMARLKQDVSLEFALLHKLLREAQAENQKLKAELVAEGTMRAKLSEEVERLLGQLAASEAQQQKLINDSLAAERQARLAGQESERQARLAGQEEIARLLAELRDKSVAAQAANEQKLATLPEQVSSLYEQRQIKTKGFTFLREATHSCGGQTHTVKEYRHDQTGLEFVLVPGGTFDMGSENGDNDEKPVHRVTVRPFLMSKYEVTQAVWEKIMGSNPSYFKGDGNLPVEQVSWNDCQEFCKKTGLSLPSEAQWEYACRAGTRTNYYWGDSMDGEYCWYTDNSGGKTHPVGTRKPNAFGLYDMSGNVWEWCQDEWHSNYQGAPCDASVWETYISGGSGRVFRGGGWSSRSPAHCRSASRTRSAAGRRWGSLGFRVVRPIS
jgi:formylglycine-generating enzyme required for sulfatase activity